MANLNTFRNITAQLTTEPTVLYAAPIGVTAIVLLAQVSNVTDADATVTFTMNNGVVDTELVYNTLVPPNDAINALMGKLVLETGHTVVSYAGSNNSLKITLSVLESLN